jgi:hypothetical protein
MTTTLILAGDVIVAAIDGAVTFDAASSTYVTPDGRFPMAAGVTGTATVDSLPPGFRSDRYVWQGGALVALPEPPAPPAPVPAEVTNYQAREALRAAGLLASVKAVVASADESTQDAWEYTNVFTRNGILVNAIGSGLGLTSDELDELFRQAVTIQA